MGDKKKHKKKYEKKQKKKRNKSHKEQPLDLDRELGFVGQATHEPTIKVVLYLQSPKDLDLLKTQLIDLIPTSKTPSKTNQTLKETQDEVLSEFWEKENTFKEPEQNDDQPAEEKKKTIFQHVKERILTPQLILVAALTAGHFLFQQYGTTILATMATNYPLIGAFALAFSLCFSKETSIAVSSITSTANAISGLGKLVDLIGKFTEGPVVK